MSRLIHSSKFWLLILDTVISLATIIMQQVLIPEKLEFALVIIATLQPVFVMVIKGITDEDVATKTYFGTAATYADLVADLEEDEAPK